MKCLIDADLLSYEISASGQYYELDDVEKTNLIIKPFDQVSEHLDQRIREIVAECNSDEAPALYLTGDEILINHLNKSRIRNEEPVEESTSNFRQSVAVSKRYKGNRNADKPYHFNNLRAYILSEYDCVVSNGMEADDLICIDLYHDYKKGMINNQFTLICCSRDKDLRMCPGWHYGWQCGKQEQFGPVFLDEFGHLELSQGNPKKLTGNGLKFFYSQLITGDPTDNIQGLPKRGPVFAYKLINECGTEGECFEAVRAAYEEVFGEVWQEHLREQCDLLWIIRELNEDGSPKFYELPKESEASLDLVEKTPDVVESKQKQSSEAS